MEKQSEQGNASVILKQYDTLKAKHPDAMLLFRHGDFYEMFKEDAVKAAALLGIAAADKMLPGEKTEVKIAAFAKDALDTYLPKLIRSGARVAICDQLDTPRQKKEGQSSRDTKGVFKEKEEIIPDNTDMAKKKKEQAAQEEPAKAVQNATEEKTAKAVKNTAQEKPEKEMKAQAQDGGKDGQEVQEADAKKERKAREPQMVTANGEKVTHGHAYQSKTNPEEWYFTAKMDGKQLKPQKMDAADLAAYQKKEMTVQQLMERYYPTKLMPKVPEESFKMPKSIAGPNGDLTVEKFNVYKERDTQRQDFGKYKFYAQVGEAKMSVVASRQDLNAYFDRVVTPQQLVEKNFGERLHLKSAYEKYQLPEGVDPKGVRVAKDHADNKWKVSVDMGEKGKTAKQEISFDDGYSLFRAKTATREQIAAKYLNTEIRGLLAANTAKLQKSTSMKM